MKQFFGFACDSPEEVCNDLVDGSQSIVIYVQVFVNNGFILLPRQFLPVEQGSTPDHLRLGAFLPRQFLPVDNPGPPAPLGVQLLDAQLFREARLLLLLMLMLPGKLTALLLSIYDSLHLTDLQRRR